MAYPDRTYRVENSDTGIQNIPIDPPRPIPTLTPDEFAKQSQTPNTPYGFVEAKNTSGPIGTPFATSSDWRISKNKDGVASHLAPNAQLPEGHELVENSNSPNINRAIINFRLNSQKNPAAIAPAPPAPAVGNAAAPAANPFLPQAAPAGKAKWWDKLQGSALDLPTRLGVTTQSGQHPAPLGKNDLIGVGNYNALNRDFGDAQRSFTDIQKEAYPDQAGIKGDVANETALHKADLLKRGETESVTVIGPNGVPMDKVFKRSPQFEEDQTMSTAKEKRAMARSKKWGQSDTIQKSWRAKYFPR